MIKDIRIKADPALKVPPGTKRSPKWRKVRAEFLKKYPKCAVCGGTKKIEVHHIVPFHIDPSKELLHSNLITLCEQGPSLNCHLIAGHRGNYQRWNPFVRGLCAFLNDYLEKDKEGYQWKDGQKHA